MTRRLCDVAQDVIIREEDCGTDRGLVLQIGVRQESGGLVKYDHVDTSVFGRTLSEDATVDGKVILPAGTDLGDRNIDELVAAGVDEVKIRSVLTLSLIHISEPTRLRCISYAVFCLKKPSNG